MRRVAIWILVLAALGAAAGAAYVRFAPVPEPVDPLAAAPPSSPNWALAAAPETPTAARPTRGAPVFATDPETLLDALDAVMLDEPRVAFLRPPGGPLTRAYTQRSALIGFPDLISAAAVDLGAGDAGRRSALVLYSRSVYGRSDLGVNGARLDRIIAALESRLDTAR